MNSAVPYSDLDGFKPYMVHNSEMMRSCLVRNGFVVECSVCHGTSWQGKPMPLQIDHINGDRFNNCRSNLRFICPNCHAQTDTYCGKNIRIGRRPELTDEAIVAAWDALREKGDTISVHAIARELGVQMRGRNEYDRVRRACLEAGRAIDSHPGNKRPKQEKITWPSDEDLASMLVKMSRVQVGAMLGVSDNAVKKRVKARGIVEPKQRRMTKSTSRLDEAKRRLATLHGTTKGYYIERRLGVETCQACRAARAEQRRAEKSS